MKKYTIIVNVCEKCGEVQVRYPVIKIGPNRTIRHLDVLCRCEKEKKQAQFEKYLEEARANLEKNDQLQADCLLKIFGDFPENKISG